MTSCPVSYYFIQLYSFNMPTLLSFPYCSLALILHSIPVMHVHIPYFTHAFTYFLTPRVPFSLCICEEHFWSGTLGHKVCGCSFHLLLPDCSPNGHIMLELPLLHYYMRFLMYSPPYQPLMLSL